MTDLGTGTVKAGIIWLASYPKSGNTWLRLFLSSYLYGNPDINRTGALGFKDTSEWAYQIVSPKPVPDLTFYDCIALKPAVLLNLLPVLASFDRKRMFLKTHSLNATIEGFSQCPRGMTKAAVYVVRDPRDVVISFANYVADRTIDESIHALFFEANMLGTPGDVRQYLGDWPQHVKSWADCTGTYVVRYEDMIADPHAAFRGVLEYLDEDVDEARLSQAVEATSFDNLRRIEQEAGFDDNPHADRPFFRKGTAGQWREVLTAKQLARIEQKAAEPMRRLGYELSTEAKVA